MKETNAIKILTGIGAAGGIYYGMRNNKSFWTTAGFTLLFAIGGAITGGAYYAIKSK